MPLSFTVVDIIEQAFFRGTTSMAFSPDGKFLAWNDGEDTKELLAVFNRQRLTLWNIEAKQYATKLHDDYSWMRSLMFSPNSQLLVGGDSKGLVHIWDVSTGQQIVVLEGHRKSINQVVFNTDGTKLASASDDNDVRIWFGDKFSTSKVLDGHRRSGYAESSHNFGEVWSVAFSPNGQLLASGSDDMTVRLWDVTTYSELTVLGHWSPASDGVRSVTFTRDGRQLAVGNENGEIQFWDVVQHKKTQQFHVDGILNHNWIRKIFFSSNDSILAAYNLPINSGRTGITFWINTFSGVEKQLFQLPEDKTIGSVAFCLGENLFAVGTEEGNGKGSIYIYRYI